MMRYEEYVTGLDLDNTSVDEPAFETQVIIADGCRVTRNIEGDDDLRDEQVCNTPAEARKLARKWGDEVRRAYAMSWREWNAIAVSKGQRRRAKLAGDVEDLLADGDWTGTDNEYKLLELVAQAIRGRRVKEILRKMCE